MPLGLLHRAARQLLCAHSPLSVAPLGSSPARPLTVAVGLSGGVDSALAALQLKQQGHDVFGVFMRNWDPREEEGDGTCPAEEDKKDAKRVAQTIGIELREVDFVAEYWNRVFETFVEEHSRGLTPNPDLDCNRHIKFEALLEHVLGLGADALATGHYARLQKLDNGEVQLLRGADKQKDQTYFLASLGQAALRKAIFPIGHLTKSEVREQAAAAGLHVAAKRGSRGICFIGKRPFSEFISKYVEPKPGTLVSVEDGKELGRVSAMSSLTYGQGARVSGLSERWFVAGKDVVEGIVYCAPGPEHLALYTRQALLRPPSWVAGYSPGAPGAASEASIEAVCKVRYGQQPVPCSIRMLGISEAESVCPPSRFCRLKDSDGVFETGSLHIQFESPVRSVTPQQASVFYNNEICLGSALIGFPGRTLYESQLC